VYVEVREENTRERNPIATSDERRELVNVGVVQPLYVSMTPKKDL
jgi:hypothetical protein